MSTSEAEAEALDDVLELQDVDARIRRLDHQLDSLPEQQELDTATTRDKSLQDEQDAARIELEKVQAAQRQAEGELDVLRQRRDAERSRMYSGDITNPRELQSLRAEIEATEKRVDEHENRVLAAMERAEELETRIGELQSERDDLAGRIETLRAARDEAAESILAEKAELEVSRDQHRGRIPDDLLTRYDDAAERFGSTPFGRLVDGMCTGCRLELPMVDANELLEGPPLGTCPQCRRPIVTV